MIAYLTLPCSYVKKVRNYKKNKKNALESLPKLCFFRVGFWCVFLGTPPLQPNPKQVIQNVCMFILSGVGETFGNVQFSLWWVKPFLQINGVPVIEGSWVSLRGVGSISKKYGLLPLIYEYIWYIILYNPYFSSQIHIDMGNHPFLVGGLEHLLWLSIYGECHDPNWRVVHHFPEGLKSTTNQIIMKTINNHHHNH